MAVLKSAFSIVNIFGRLDVKDIGSFIGGLLRCKLVI